MTPRRAALWCGVGLAAVLLVVAMAVALAVHRPDLLRPWVERAITPRGGTASLSGLNLSLSPLVLVLTGLEIAPPPHEGDLLRLDRLKLEVIPRRLFDGGPWLRHVEAKGLVFERPRPRETTGPPDLTPLTRLFDIEDLSVTDARLRVALPQGDLSADGVRLGLVPGEGGVRAFTGHGEITFRRAGSTVARGTLSAEGNVIPVPEVEADVSLSSARLTLPEITGDLSGKTRLKMTKRHFQAEDLILALEQARISLGPKAKENLGAVRLRASAGATLEAREPHLEVQELDLGGLLLARGNIGGPSLEKMSGRVEGTVPRVERVKSVLAPLLPTALAGVNLAGGLPFALRLSSGGTAAMLAVELSPGELAVSWPGEGFSGRFGGFLKAQGPVQDFLQARAGLSGQIQGTGRLDRPPIAVRSFRFDTPLAGWIAAPALPGWTLSTGAGEVIYDRRPLPLGSVELRGKARQAGKSFLLEEVEIRSDSLGRLTGNLSYRDGGASGRLEGTGIPADNLAALARALSGQERESWSPTGSIDLAARLEPAPGGSRVAATSTLHEIGFSSPEGDVMGQNLAGRIDLDALLGREPLVKADLAIGRGEALWGTVYADFAKIPLDLHAQGKRTGPEEYEDLALEGGLAGFGRLRVEGEAHRAKGSWRHQGRASVADARLGPVFRTFLRDPMAAKHRDLAGLSMDGTAALDLAFSGVGQAADLTGTLTVRSGGVRRAEEPPLLSGLDIDLPIAYSLGAEDPGRPRPSDADRWGRLKLKTLLVADQDLGPLEMPAVLVPNRLYLGGEIDLSLFGADLSLRRIRVEEPLSPSFRVAMAAELSGLDLARVAGEKPMLQGTLGGLLDPVVIDLKRMTSKGELSGDLFGGKLTVRNVIVERPFSPGREIGADMAVRMMDLERFSEALGAGRITGRLSGTLEGLRVAYGQPVAYHLRVESVPAKGVNQSVSLKAVNSISLVSTGSALSGLGVTLMTTFFKQFPFEKIGIESRLRNDVFTVRGTIHEDGVEYLVKRRFFGGINVINRNPDNRIGFSDMVERTKRVTGERSR